MSSPRSRYYILIEGQPTPADVRVWAQWMEDCGEERLVNRTSIGSVGVSTVFLGLDHNFSKAGPPILYETMVFGGELNDCQERYSTQEMALLGHEEWCDRVR